MALEPACPALTGTNGLLLRTAAGVDESGMPVEAGPILSFVDEGCHCAGTANVAVEQTEIIPRLMPMPLHYSIDPPSWSTDPSGNVRVGGFP